MITTNETSIQGTFAATLFALLNPLGMLHRIYRRHPHRRPTPAPKCWPGFGRVELQFDFVEVKISLGLTEPAGNMIFGLPFSLICEDFTQLYD